MGADRELRQAYRPAAAILREEDGGWLVCLAGKKPVDLL
jgi:hypothetical protein